MRVERPARRPINRSRSAPARATAARPALSGYSAAEFETKTNEELFTHSVAETLDVASEDGSLSIVAGKIPR